jgi:cytoskeletal protein RodZ
MEEEFWEEDWEESQYEPQYETKTSKKVLGIPLAVFIALVAVVVLVAAAVVYNYVYVPYNTSFTKNITISAPTNGTENVSTQTVYVSIVAHGDISNSILNCDLDGINSCDITTGNIVLINNDPTNSHTCTVNTIQGDGGNDVMATYTGITNPVTIPASSNVTFRVNYAANVSGSYPMTTTINCP